MNDVALYKAAQRASLKEGGGHEGKKRYYRGRGMERWEEEELQIPLICCLIYFSLDHPLYSSAARTRYRGKGRNEKEIAWRKGK